MEKENDGMRKLETLIGLNEKARKIKLVIRLCTYLFLFSGTLFILLFIFEKGLAFAVKFFLTLLFGLSLVGTMPSYLKILAYCTIFLLILFIVLYAVKTYLERKIEETGEEGIEITL